jgi:hypothetical protein
MVLVESIVVTPELLSAEPLANNIVAVTTKGEVDFSAVQVALNDSVNIWVSAIVISSDYLLACQGQQPYHLRASRRSCSLNHLLHSCGEFLSW